MTDVAKLLAFDPLDTAETMTGQTVEGGGLTFGLGLAFLQEKARRVKAAMQERGDIWDGCPLAHYLDVVARFGFELLLEDPFTVDGRAEKFLVLGHSDGLLLSFDTYDSNRVNGGNVYYNWRPSPAATRYEYTSSGGFVGPDYEVWSGHHDCREALIFNLEQLRANGEFLPQWKARPFLWLVHYGETREKGCDHASINEERIARFPDWARKMVGSAS